MPPIVGLPSSVTFVEPYKKIACLLWETSSRFFVRATKLDVMPKNVNKLLVRIAEKSRFA